MKTRPYFSVFRLRWRMEMQYRGAVIGGFLCQVFFGLVLIALYRALYDSRPQSMPIESVATYVWLQQAFFRMVLSSDPELLDKIRTGAIAYDLCRPMDLYGYYYFRIVAQKAVGSLLRGIPMLIFALCLPEGWRIQLPSSFFALMLSLVSLFFGLLCISALENITMGITMRTLDPRGMQAMLNLLMTLLSGNILPLTLYPDQWQRVITLLPYAQLLDSPIRLYTGVRALSEAAWVLMLQLFWTVILILGGLLLWNRNREHLTVQGG